MQPSPADSFDADDRGRGLFWGVEFVKDKATKECFPFSVPLSDTIEAELIAGGVVAYPTKGAVSVARPSFIQPVRPLGI